MFDDTSNKGNKVPKSNHILFLPGFSIRKTLQAAPLVIEATYNRKSKCPHCFCKRLRIKDTFMRKVRHESIGERWTTIMFKAHKFQCYNCKRYFNQRFEGIKPYQRATERLKSQVFQQHSQGVSQSDMASYYHLGQATVERWYRQFYNLHNRFIKNRHWPSVIGIDEHFFKKRQFATTICDLRRHRVFDLVLGRQGQQLKTALADIPGRDKVKVACIDLSTTYRSFIKQFFPNAMIVADRFHIVRLVEHAFMQTNHSINENIRYQRGTLAILRTSPDNLSEHKKQKLKAFLQANPAIEALYQFKLRILDLLKQKQLTAKRAKKLIPVFFGFIKQLKESKLEHLIKLGKTLYKWREEIARMWRFTKNNGITEGFHRKMKLIQRRAYGFKNFENYRLRVRVLCS